MVSAIFLLLTIFLILKWSGRKIRVYPTAPSTTEKMTEVPLPNPASTPAETYTRSVDTEENITATGAPFSYLDARALLFWNQKATDYKVPSYYVDSAFGRNAEPARLRLMKSEPQYLKIGDVEKSIELKKVPELKELLAARGLKVSGKKAELIQRLIDNIPKSELEVMFPIRVYEITQLGEEALKYYSIIFANENYNLGLSYYRLLRAKETNRTSSDEDILIQLLCHDMKKAEDCGKREDYHITAGKTANFLAEIGQTDKAFGLYCTVFFLCWYRNTSELGIDPHAETYRYQAKAIDTAGKLCGYNWKEVLTHFRESVQEINPFGLGTNRNIDQAIKVFKQAFSV